WNLLLGRSTSDLVAFAPLDPSGELTLIAGVFGFGLLISTQQTGVWGPWTQITDPASSPATPFGRIALGQCAGSPRTVYALFALDSLVKLARTDDGGASWSSIAVRLNTDAVGGTEPNN